METRETCCSHSAASATAEGRQVFGGKAPAARNKPTLFPQPCPCPAAEAAPARPRTRGAPGAQAPAPSAGSARLCRTWQHCSPRAAPWPAARGAAVLVCLVLGPDGKVRPECPVRSLTQLNADLWSRCLRKKCSGQYIHTPVSSAFCAKKLVFRKDPETSG